jgi:glycine/D-amino acid oxidase-like deaminating enzyme
MNAAGIAIIGGGTAGVSAAYHLSELGHRVVLLERNAIAAHASGRNSGLFSATPSTACQISRRSSPWGAWRSTARSSSIGRLI